MNLRQLEQFIRREVAASLREQQGQVEGAVVRVVLSKLDTATGFSVTSADGRDDEEIDEAELLEPYGLTSAPPAGSEGIGLQVGGDPSHHVVINVGARSLRLKSLKTGEVALYSQHGQTIVLKENGDVVVTPGATGNVLLGGDAAVKRVALAEDVAAEFAAFKADYTAHTHVVGMVTSATPVPPAGATGNMGSDNVLAKG